MESNVFRGCVISAFGELRDLRRLDREGLKLIDKLVRGEVRRFPVLTPTGGWQPADLEDLVSGFLVDRLEKVTANLLALASDDASMGRLLRRSIRNWLVDQSRKTGVGRMRSTVEVILAAEDAFERVPAGEVGAGRWRLAGTSVFPYSSGVDDLVKAARAVPNVKIPKWSSSTRRQPMADRASIVAVVRAVLVAAGGSLEVAQLVQVFVARFPVVLDPAVGPLLDDPDMSFGFDEGLTPEQQVIAAEDEVEAAVTAAEVVGMLAPWERQIVGHLQNPQAIQTVLGCGRSQAYHHKKRLTEKLEQLVGDCDNVDAVRREVVRLCGGAVAK
jgi:hypothetical protein